ncbi:MULTISPECIES: ATP-binding protein [Bacillus subtilis group]|uniref:ATP-binding protein n=2 Tax=Bacillaceae TaxID=186817 RepID=UPI001EEA45AE|nr:MULTISPECIES: ATP-binding protein [Bacillus subtilis group]WRU08164.1 ATP-binding protein [Bacillus subtilis]
MKYESDILAVCENVIYTKDKRQQLWVEFKGFHTSFDSEAQLIGRFNQLKRLFKEMKRELHCLVVPVRQSLNDVYERYTREFRGNLKSVGIEHTKAIFDYLQDSDELGSEENKMKFYVGIELGQDTMNDQNVEDMSYSEIFANIKEYLSNITDRLRGQHSVYLGQELLEKTRRSARKVQSILDSFEMSYKKLSTEEMSELLPWIFNIGIRHLPDNKGWAEKYTPVYGKGGEVVARVQTEEEVMKLQMTGIENSKDRLHLVLNQTDAYGNNQKTYISFLHMTTMDDIVYFPETRWLEPLRHLEFSVGVSLKMSYQNVDKRISKLRLKKSNLEDQANHLAQFGEDAGSNVYDGIATANQTIAEEEKQREGSFLMSAIFVVSASSREQLDVNVTSLIEEYSSVGGIQLQNTFGLQLRSLMECLPGSRRYVTEFIQDVDVNAVTSSFFGNRQELGDDYGSYIGRTASGTSVFMRPGRAASAQTSTQSLVRVLSGKTGAGKSMAGNSLIYEGALYGTKVLLIDPKSERKDILHWDEKLTELGTELNFISFTTKDEDAGKLDPWLIFENRQDASDVAREIINYLLNISIRKDVKKSTLVAKACTRVSQRKQPAIRFVKTELREAVKSDPELTEDDREIAKDLANILEQFESISLARLFFAERTNSENHLDATKQFNILQVADLALPPKGLPEEEYSEQNIISVAVLFGLSSYMIKFLRMFPNDLTEIVIEEAWNFFNNAAGTRLIDKIFREGRSLLSPVTLMTQNIKDIPKELRGQIGAAYCFKADNKDEIKAIQEFLQLDDSAGIEQLLPSLPSGWCLHRDLDNRVGLMQFRVLQDHLYNAFDTSKDLSEMVNA